jgi:hypothetical protein
MNRLTLAERWMSLSGLVLVAYFAFDAMFSMRNVERLRAEGAGFDRHFVKPIGEEALRTLFDDSRPTTQRAPAVA